MSILYYNNLLKERPIDIKDRISKYILNRVFIMWKEFDGNFVFIE